MKKNNRIRLSIGLLTMWMAIHPAVAANVETKKETRFTSSTDARTLLTADSRFSDIDIQHWNQDKAEITAIVTVKAKKEKTALRYLDDTKVEIKKKGNTICIEDKVPDRKQQNDEEIRITYTIFIPDYIPLDISQQFGSLQLPDLNKSACTLHIRFGDLTAGDFRSPLTLESAFSKIKLNNVEEAHLEISHSDRVKIGNGKNIQADLRFTGLKTGNVDTFDLTLQHSSLTAGTCGEITLACNFSEVRFNSVTGKLDASTIAHSNVDAGTLSPVFTSVGIEANFSEIRLKLASETAFALDAVSHFGDIKLNRAFSLLTDPRDTQSDYHTRKFIGPVNGGSKKTFTYEGNHSTLSIEPTR